MHYFLEDLTGFAAATLLAILLILLPGFAIADLLGRAKVIDKSDGKRACWGLLLAPTLLPAVDALLLRWVGFPGVLALHIPLALVGARSGLNAARQVPPRWWLAVLGCWVLVAWANLDFDWNHRLNQPLTILDTVKHAAVVTALAKGGLPLYDPFFNRSAPAGYYYFFYLGPAMLRWVGAALVDGRTAFAAGTLVTLLAFPAMLLLVADAAALIPQGARRRFVRLVLLLCCVSGLDLIPGLAIAALAGVTLPQLDWWSEEVRWALTSILWVPHHLTAVLAVFAGALVLAAKRNKANWIAVLVAGMAFATAFGCSVWIAVAAAPILAVWWLVDLRSPERTPFWVLPSAAAVALLLLVPQIRDLLAGRATGGPPLGFYIRTLGPIPTHPHSIGESLFWIAMNPGGYIIEFGLFMLGAVTFLRTGCLAESRATSIGRLLLVGAPLALLMATFVRSIIIYNDFGWRAIWFAQIPAILWTASILSGEPSLLRKSPLWSAAVALGLAATMWDLAGMRLIRKPDFNVSLAFINAEPRVDYDLRGTYRWIDTKLPPSVVVQHNPPVLRAIDFGLYGAHRVAVADVQAQLFGADERAVSDRVRLLAPIFEQPMPPEELRRRAATAGVGALVLTSADPLWSKSGGPPASWQCAYRSPNSCVMLLGEPQ